MNRNLSIFLDLLRLGAAMLVLVGHTAAVYRMQLPDIVGHSAKEGVAIFFVLSGFVIAFVTSGKEKTWQAFANARALRMYSVIPLAIVVLVLCHAIGSAVVPTVYTSPTNSAFGGGGALIGDAPSLMPVLRYLTFTNELWFDRVVIETGAPFWSLGFEVAYYVGFAILYYARGHWRWTLGLAWLLICGPRIVIAFPLWLVGVGAWHLVQRHRRISGAQGAAALVMIGLLAFAWRNWGGIYAIPLFEWREAAALMASMLYYLGLCMLVAAAIVVFAACTSADTIWPQWAVRAVPYCAGASFTIYIAHLPVMVLIAALWPASIGTTFGGWTAVAMVLCAMFALAELGERRKNFYRRNFRLAYLAMAKQS